MMKTFLFIAKPRWKKDGPECHKIIEAENEKEARDIARFHWAMQGRLPNNTIIKEI